MMPMTSASTVAPRASSIARQPLSTDELIPERHKEDEKDGRYGLARKRLRRMRTASHLSNPRTPSVVTEAVVNSS